jgi:hypothetical protein
MNLASLTEEFVAKGYVRVEGAFSAKAAAGPAERALERFAKVVPESRERFGTPLGTTLPHETSFPLAELAPAALEAIHALAGGPERLAGPAPSFSDGFVVAPPGAKKWRAPDPYRFGWHVDGAMDAMRRPESAEVGLVLYGLWSDVKPKGGGTFFAPGATPRLARLLDSRKDGWRKSDLPYELCLLAAKDPGYFELTGPVGTVLITHPLLLHAASWNASKTPRLLSPRIVALKEPMRLGRWRADMTPLERATEALVAAGGPGPA